MAGAWPNARACFNKEKFGLIECGHIDQNGFTASWWNSVCLSSSIFTRPLYWGLLYLNIYIIYTIVQISLCNIYELFEQHTAFKHFSGNLSRGFHWLRRNHIWYSSLFLAWSTLLKGLSLPQASKFGLCQLCQQPKEYHTLIRFHEWRHNCTQTFPERPLLYKDQKIVDVTRVALAERFDSINCNYSHQEGRWSKIISISHFLELQAAQACVT